MKLEHKFLITALLAIALALPVSMALKHKSNLLNIEKSRTNQLQLQLKTEQEQLQIKEREKVDQQKKIDEQQQKLNEQAKQLQSKREATKKLAQAPKAPVAVSGGGNCESYRSLLADYNWDVRTAMAVMRAESGCNSSAVSHTCDSGLMQINCVHRAKVGGNLELLKDPATNIRVAYAIYSGAGGWSPWVAYTSGAYLRYY